MQTKAYLISVGVAAIFLVAWIWFFKPGITLPEGLVGVALAVALRHILYKAIANRRD